MLKFIDLNIEVLDDKECVLSAINSKYFSTVVGIIFYFLYLILHLEILKENAYKLYFFKVKIELNLSNLRQCYYQTVSKSPCAH